jgi:hypothetical protein
MIQTNQTLESVNQAMALLDAWNSGDMQALRLQLNSRSLPDGTRYYSSAEAERLEVVASVVERLRAALNGAGNRVFDSRLDVPIQLLRHVAAA